MTRSGPLGDIVIEGVDASVPELEVGVLAVSLLAGGQGRVPLFNRGDAAVEFGSPQVEGPFDVEDHPSELGPGEAGEIVLSYGGSGGDQGLLTLVSDDPLRPRVSIALSGLEVREAVSDLVHLRADASGRIESGLDLEEQDLVLALYAAPVERIDRPKVYAISLDGSSSLARPAVAARPDRRDSVDYLARQLERTLSLRVQQKGRWAGKPAAVQYEVGDSRVFRFAGDGGVPGQSFKARVAAVNDLVVAWIQDDLREDDDNIDEDRMQGVIDQFAEDYPIVVEAFGTPSDVDGDGRIAVLVTHLMQDIGAGGQFRASSLVPRSWGGDGNMTDLLWANPVIPEESYRSLLAHEFQHLISFNQHVLVRQGISEAPWLNEGLSHLAEDLVEEPPNENYRLVRIFLSEPGSVGLGRGIPTFHHARGGLPLRAQPGRSAGGRGAAAPGADRPRVEPRQRRGRHRRELRRPDGPLGGAALRQRHRSERPSETQLPPGLPAPPGGKGLSTAGPGDLAVGRGTAGAGDQALGPAVPPRDGRRQRHSEPADRARSPAWAPCRCRLPGPRRPLPWLPTTSPASPSTRRRPRG